MVARRRRLLLELVDCSLRTSYLMVRLSELVVHHPTQLRMQHQLELQPERVRPIPDCLLPVACSEVVAR
jgi:hypothetical protein